MSSVSVGLEVLAIIVVLLVIAVACCCVAFCVFQMIQQEFRTTERMMIMNAMPAPNDAKTAGMKSIQIKYHPEEYQNGQMMQNNDNVNYQRSNYSHQRPQPLPQHQPLRQVPGTTTIQQTTITTTVAHTPAAPPTHAMVHAQPAQSTRVYIGTATQQLRGARRLGFTTANDPNDADEKEQIKVTEIKNNSGDSNNDLLARLIKINKDKGWADNPDNYHKTFDDKTQVSQVSQEPVDTQKTKEVQKEEEQNGLKQMEPLKPLKPLRYRRGKPKEHLSAWVLWKGQENVSFDELLKQGDNEQHEERQYSEEFLRSWRWMRGKQRTCINAERDGWDPVNALNVLDERTEQNIASARDKKTN